VHHVTIASRLEGLYLTAPNVTGDPAVAAKAKCERAVDGQGQPTAAFSCTNL
jgi:hypothetical protein